MVYPIQGSKELAWVWRLDLPRTRFQNLEGFLPEESVFRTLILEEYQKIHTVRSVEEFQTIFVDVVGGTFLL